MIRGKFVVSLAMLLSLIATSPAKAADAEDEAISPMVGVVDDTSTCWYARIGSGADFFHKPKISQVAGSNSEKIKTSGFIEAGGGCQITDYLRLEAMAAAHFSTKVHDKGYNNLTADMRSITSFVNAYWDMTSLAGFTPYIGGGVGIAHHRLNHISKPSGAKSHSTTQFAYNLQAGVSYDLTDDLKLDVGYQFSDLGTAKSGGERFKVKDIQTHAVKFGVRYQFSW